MRKTAVSFMVLIIINLSASVNFRRKLVAAGFSHFKILMTLGTCKERRVFVENKIWPSMPVNRVFDIYYKSGMAECRVSRVEIYLVVNHSDVLASSEDGVGGSEFSASVYLPADGFVIFYSLQIFTCSHPNIENPLTEDPLYYFDVYSSKIY